MDQHKLDLLNQVKFDDIVHVQYNEETLMTNFKNIVEVLKTLQLGHSQNEKEIQNNGQVIKDLKDTNDRVIKENQQMSGDIKDLQKENQDLRDQLKKLNDRVSKQESDHADLKDDHAKSKDRILQNEKDIEELQRHNKALLNQIKDLQNQLNDLKNDLENVKSDVNQLKYQVPSTNEGSGVDSGALQNLIREIENLKNNYVKKEDFNAKCNHYDNKIQNLEDEIEALKKLFEKLQQQLADLSSQLDNLELKIENISGQSNKGGVDPSELQELRDMIKKRVDLEKFEREINGLRSLINQLSNIGEGKNVQIVSGFGEEEKKLLDNLVQKIENLEEQLRKLRRDLDQHQQDYGQNKKVTDDRLTNLENQLKFKASENDLLQAKDSIKQIENLLNQTSQLANENKEKIKKLKNMTINGGGGNNVANFDMDGVSEELVDEKISKCRQELLNLLTALKEEKVSFDDLWKSEAVILEKLDEVAGALLKKLADKGDTKKALIYLEKKINQLYMMITKGQGGSQQDGDGLLIKRPLFWSCMSCDKELDKLQGKVGDYKNWAVFPPKETTPERMGRFGKGYKQLLEKSRMKEERMRMEHSQVLQQQNDSQLPTLNKTPGMAKPPSQQGYTDNIM